MIAININGILVLVLIKLFTRCFQSQVFKMAVLAIKKYITNHLLIQVHYTYFTEVYGNVYKYYSIQLYTNGTPTNSFTA